MELKEFFGENSRVALAFSGGTDSAYLMYAAKASGADVHAYYVRTPFQPKFEYEDAMSLAKDLDCQLTVIDTDVLSNERIRSNPANRCYYCKNMIFGLIKDVALADGYETIIDGTNASDSFEDRPGMKALEEMKVLSPLRCCGITKTELRRLSHEAGLRTWDKPSYSCLATRVKPGLEITAELLSRLESAEMKLMALGLKGFRVRTDGSEARLEVTAEDMELVLTKRTEILKALGASFDRVVMGLEARENE